MGDRFRNRSDRDCSTVRLAALVGISCDTRALPGGLSGPSRRYEGNRWLETVFQQSIFQVKKGGNELFMDRTLAREIAMKRLYADSVGGADTVSDILEQSDCEPEITENCRQFSESLYNGTISHLAEIDDVIGRNATGWSFERIAKVDLSILRLAAFEILYVEKIPEGASINEAVELGKKYGGEKSAKFINGVLGAIARSGLPI